MKQKFHDLSRVPPNGFLVFPLSMSRLSQGLSPENLYQFLEFFLEKLSHFSVDVILLYTDGVYLNSEEMAFSLRKKLFNQMVNHQKTFDSMVLKGRQFIPGAFHCLSWDQVLLKAHSFSREFTRLTACLKTDPHFREAIAKDLEIAKRPWSDTNIQFLLEELVVSHLITEKEVPLPNKLANPDGWRLLCYPGNPPVSLVYLWDKNLLGNRKDLPLTHQLYASSFYNMELRVLIDFNTAASR